ncbi:6-phosphogluconolactonase [Ilumatobacter sp.]|uniref:6-phosphogluconolactonase n=1 Tax=Ilumatobacter sp. TaxID=1967498 RepID=UPI003B52F51E
MDVRISSDPASAAAAFVAERLRDAIADRGSATIAVSGGSTAPPLFDALVDPGVGGDVDWSVTTVFQVDERVAPDGDADRNAGQLVVLPCDAVPMPVTAIDLVAEARRYGDDIVDPLDVVHLGLGDDGHTASWPPDPHPDADRALTSTERSLVVAEFDGRVRMTLGRPVVDAARCRVVLVAGEAKAPAVERWLGGRELPAVDTTLPIAAVGPDGTVVFLDHGAASLLGD